MRESTYEGHWRCASEREQAIGGRLDISSSNGPVLETFGELTRNDEMSLETTRVPIIFGSARANGFGEDVTLLNSVRTQTRGSDRSVTQTFITEFALIGSHIADLNIPVTRAEVHFSQLDLWLDVTGFDARYAEQPQHGYSISYQRPNLPVVNANVAEFSFGVRSHRPLMGYRTWPLRETPFVAIRPRNACSLETLCDDLIWKLQAFFALAADQSNGIVELRVWFQGYDRPVEVLYRHPFKPECRRHVLEYLFTYSRIADRATTVIDKWFDLYTAIGPVINALTTVWFEHVKLADARFITLAQAAESYHRRTIGNELRPKDEHQNRLDAILAACPAEYRSWVELRLRGSNAPPFEDRIRQLFARLDPSFLQPMFGTAKVLNANVAEIRQWRNDLTHLNVDSDHIESNIPRLVVAANQLFVGLVANILLDLGFSNGELRERFDQCERYRYFARQRPTDH